MSAPSQSGSLKNRNAAAARGDAAAIGSAFSGPSVEHLGIDVSSDSAGYADAWRAFQATAVGGPHQTYEWVRAWSAETAGRSDPEAAIVFLCEPCGSIRAILPFQIRRRLGLRHLEWFRAEHGNYSFGLFDRGLLRELRPASFETVWKRILHTLPRIDVVKLVAQPGSMDGFGNPFAALPMLPASEPSHALTVPEAGWEAHFAQRFSSGSRRKLRQLERRLGEHGVLSFASAEAEAEKSEFLRVMIEQKREWLALMGIEGFLADPATLRAYERLLARPAGQASASALVCVLKAGDEIVAASYSVRFQESYYGLLLSTTNGPLRQLSPGRLLYKKLVEHLAERGVARIDFGVGRDPEKQRWCSESQQLFHTLLPVTAAGRLYVGAERLRRHLKSRVKSSAAFWTTARRLRRLKAALWRRPAAP